MINSNLGPILHGVGDTAVYWSKNRQFILSLRNRPRSGWPLSNFVMNQIFLETKCSGSRMVKKSWRMIFFVLIQYRSVTDRQTDIPPVAIPAVCKARYANALVKTAAGGSNHILWHRLLNMSENWDASDDWPPHQQYNNTVSSYVCVYQWQLRAWQWHVVMTVLANLHLTGMLNLWNF